MDNNPILSFAVTACCVLLPVLLFWHIYATLNYESPEREEHRLIRERYLGDLHVRRNHHCRLFHSDTMNKLADLRSHKRLIENRIVSLTNSMPTTIARDHLLAEWNNRLAEKSTRIKKLEHELNRYFVTAEVKSLEVGFQSLPAIGEEYANTLRCINKASAIYRCLIVGAD